MVMQTLSATELSRMRATQEAAMPDSCQVKRRVETGDGLGGTGFTWPSVTHTYDCRLSTQGIPAEYLRYARETRRQSWMVTMARGSDVLATDQLVIGTRTLEILGFASGGAWETALRVICAEAL